MAQGHHPAKYPRPLKSSLKRAGRFTRPLFNIIPLIAPVIAAIIIPDYILRKMEPYEISAHHHGLY